MKKGRQQYGQHFKEIELRNGEATGLGHMIKIFF